MKSSFEQNGGTYRRVGDYNIPNLILPPEEVKIRLGKWGQLHRDYLIKHKQALFTILLSEGRLYSYLADIDRQADGMFSRLVKQMAEHEGLTEELKEENQMEWVCRMNNIEARAREVVNNELIFI